MKNRLEQLEYDMRTLHNRIWLAIVALGAMAAAPYVEIVQALLGAGS